MSKASTQRWDAADNLKTEADMVAHLEAALEEGDAALFVAAVGDVAQPKGWTDVARKIGLGRESL